jgi:REP element-mobilizing transposase RayT
MCTKDRDPLFGTIEKGMMNLSEAGEIAAECWKQIPEHFPNTKLDEFMVMPDHLHGIVVITDETEPLTESVPGGAIQESPRLNRDNPLWRRRMLLPKIIGRFKQNSAKQINILRGTPEIPVWQRGYHDHIIRDADSLSRIRQYIIVNPQH